MREKTVFVLAVLAAVSLVACGGDSGSSPAAPQLEQAGGGATQAVCHEAQQTIDVPIGNLEEHLEHGDWLIGPEVCDGQDNNCDGHIDEGGVCEAD